MQRDYPITLKDNLLYRTKLHNKCLKSQKVRNLVYDMCSKDIIYWIDNFCWTYNPRKPQSPHLPFICYEFQVTEILEIKKSIEEGYDILYEKTREMGLTWMVLYVLEWFDLFRDGSTFRTGSWKEDYVDKIGEMDGHFEKIRYTLKRLPNWMFPNSVRPEIPFMKCVMDNGNTIVGETSGKNFGSGGRKLALFLDELAKWDESESTGAWTSTADITSCRIVVSTPVGASNKYARLAKKMDGAIRVRTVHWTMHPEKAEGCYLLGQDGFRTELTYGEQAFDQWKKHRYEKAPGDLRGGVVRSPWYDYECIRRKPQEIAQELDIDFLSSGSPYFDLREIQKHRIWELFERPIPSAKIPWGRYILANIIKIDHKIEIRERPDGFCRIFELPKSGHMYIIGADTSEGLPKGDFNYAVVREKSTTNTVATIKGLYKPEDFSEMLYYLSLYYNTALLAPENNNHGYSVCSDIDQLGGKLYHTKAYETKKGTQTTPKRGFTTNRQTRESMLTQMEEETRMHSCEIRDGDIINQCMTFVRPENKPNHPEADGTFHDDGVIAFAICGFVMRETPHKASHGTHSQQKSLVRDLQKRKRIRYKKAG